MPPFFSTAFSAWPSTAARQATALIDGFQFTPVALALIAGGFALGLAYVVSTIVGLVWPAPFMAKLIGDADLVTAVNMTFPIIVTLVAGTVSGLGALGDPRVRRGLSLSGHTNTHQTRP